MSIRVPFCSYFHAFFFSFASQVSQRLEKLILLFDKEKAIKMV